MPRRPTRAVERTESGLIPHYRAVSPLTAHALHVSEIGLVFYPAESLVSG
jgi:hypothetical protein